MALLNHVLLPRYHKFDFDVRLHLGRSSWTTLATARQFDTFFVFAWQKVIIF